MLCTNRIFLQIAIISMMLSDVIAWDQAELDMYDLIEEIGMKPNFYEVLGLQENATSAEVRRSFRQLSLIHHPDKSDAEDAEIKFRHLVAVYEILRDSSKREMYDRYLVEGMPDWRSAIYYYRRARKMGMMEITIILSIITTVGQYLTAWAGYKEKRLTMEDAVRSKFKRELKMGKDVDIDALVEECMKNVEKPSWWNTLPLQLMRAVRWLVTSAPFELIASVRAERERRAQQKAAREQAEREAEHQRLEIQRQRDKKKEIKERRRQRLQELPEGGPESDEAAASGPAGAAAAPTRTWSTAKSGFWSDEDLVELARLVKRYPPGTPERWEVIAEALERTVAEVTQMARRIKERPHMVPVSAGAQNVTANGQLVADTALEPPVPERRKVKTRAAAAGGGVEEAVWSQTQQKALEAALAQFPKGTAERWERIAKAVPGKTKEECMLRFKYLAEIVKKRKEAESQKDEDVGGVAESQDSSEAAKTSVQVENVDTSMVKTLPRCSEDAVELPQ